LKAKWEPPGTKQSLERTALPALSPRLSVPGQPKSELERISGPQKLSLLFIAVGFVSLVALLAYLPDLATPFR
jgi:hypothetical protein